MKQRFLKLIVAALGFLLGMSLLGQEEAAASDAIIDPSDKDFADMEPNVYGPGPTTYDSGCSLINID